MANNFRALCWPMMAILVASGVLHLTAGTPVPDPKPQLLPGQIPSHIASHPALSSVAQGKESALYQFAYNTANRRGPSPSPLVLQNNQERNLHLANQYAQQRSGQPYLSNPVNTGINGHSHGTGGNQNQNPEVRALEELQRIKQGATSGPNQIPQGTNQYQPQPFTNGGFPQQHQQQGGHHHGHQGQGHLHSSLGDDDEREDIKKLKSLLNLPSGPLPNSGAGSPTIGVAGERGILNPNQFPQNRQQQQPYHNHGHDHSHSHNPSSTPFPVTAQSQNALGSLQFGHGTGRPYPGQYNGPTGSPQLNVPYGNGGSSYPQDSQYAQGQGRFYNDINYNLSQRDYHNSFHNYDPQFHRYDFSNRSNRFDPNRNRNNPPDTIQLNRNPYNRYDPRNNPNHPNFQDLTRLQSIPNNRFHNNNHPYPYRYRK